MPSTAFPVTEMIGEAWKMEEAKLAKDQNARRVFLKNGIAPASRRDLPQSAVGRRAETHRRRGRRRPSTRGAIAKAILKTSDRLGGKLAAADLSEFVRGMGGADLHRLSRLESLRAAAERPGHRRARDAEHHVAVPALHLCARAASIELHTQMEAQKLAYADLHRYVADPHFSQDPGGGHALHGLRPRRAPP